MRMIAPPAVNHRSVAASFFNVHYCGIYRQQHRELVMLLCAETFYSAGVLHISYLK